MENKQITVAALTNDQYARLKAAIPGAVTLVTSQTTELQAGYQLGVQAVLTALRDGFVSGS